jgi:hypothetical protein
LVNRWVKDGLTQEPGMFDRAYSHLFAAELSQSERPPSAKDPPEAWAVKRFWQAKASPGRVPVAGERGSPSQPLSRYLTDFQVLT